MNQRRILTFGIISAMCTVVQAQNVHDKLDNPLNLPIRDTVSFYADELDPLCDTLLLVDRYFGFACALDTFRTYSDDWTPGSASEFQYIIHDLKGKMEVIGYEIPYGCEQNPIKILHHFYKNADRLSATLVHYHYYHTDEEWLEVVYHYSPVPTGTWSQWNAKGELIQEEEK